jgi:serine/threonine protein kinase
VMLQRVAVLLQCVTLGFTDEKGIYHVDKHEILRGDQEISSYDLSSPGKYTFTFTNIGSGRIRFKFVLGSNGKCFKEENKGITNGETFSISFHCTREQVPVTCVVTTIKDEEKKFWTLFHHHSYEYSYIIHLNSQTGTIKHWSKGEFISSGSFGKVYKAIDSNTGMRFAVKQVELKSDEISKTKIATLKSEMDMLSKLNHPRIVKYLGSEITNENLYIFLEYFPSGTLQDHRKCFDLNEKIIVNIATQILEGLVYLHSKGIVHRDIKSNNILIDTLGNCYLVDFGSAKFLEDLNWKKIEGTLNYMAPEFFRKGFSGKYTPECDIWSFGAVILELLTGSAPFAYKLKDLTTQEQFITWRMYNNDRLVIPENMSQEARAFLEICLADDPKLRWSAQKLLLHPWLHQDIIIDGPIRLPICLVDDGEHLPSVNVFDENGFDLEDIPEPPPIITYVFGSNVQSKLWNLSFHFQ